jgi:hypothetical protein
MHSIHHSILATCMLFCMSLATAYACDKCDNCCGSMGGPCYCDSSAGRMVCSNGEYSTCYCTRHAVMNLQKLRGCCLWQGGVLKTDINGHVLCRNGTVSEICGLGTPVEKIAAY